MRKVMLLLAVVGWTAGLAPPSLADDWPQWRGPRRDAVWRETGVSLGVVF